MIFLFLFLSALVVEASEVPNFDHLESTKNAVIFMSTPRSGTNLVTGTLSAITRKPIAWLNWGYEFFEENSKFKDNPSSNRLELPLVSENPLLYRAHYEFDKLKKIPSHKNLLIFVTRNPKELIFRRFFQLESDQDAPDSQLIHKILDSYLEMFAIYDGWKKENRSLVFYEDFIKDGDQIVLDLLTFMNEEPRFYIDYLTNKEEYLRRLLKSYKKQHREFNGGASCKEGPQAIHYTKDAPIEVLQQIDDYIKEKAPTIWNNYLKRFETNI